MYARYIPPKKNSATVVEKVRDVEKASKKRKREIDEGDGVEVSPQAKERKKQSKSRIREEFQQESQAAPEQAIHIESVGGHDLVGKSSNAVSGPDGKQKRRRKRKHRTGDVDEPVRQEINEPIKIKDDCTEEVPKEQESDQCKDRKLNENSTAIVKKPKKTKRKNDESQDSTLVENGSVEKEHNETSETEEAPSKHQSILSKYRKSTQTAKKPTENEPTAQDRISESVQHVSEDGPALAGLTALPQPLPVQQSESKPIFSALPEWLAQPVRVSSSEKMPLKEYDIAPKLLLSLEKKGFSEAFAIQAAVLPMLLPSPTRHDGDVCISAATGSGKTLAYVLPMMESLRDRMPTRVRALVIVPTRELVTQAREVCELCGAGSRLKVQVAVGSRPFKTEQQDLIERRQVYDEALAQKALKRLQGEGMEEEYDPRIDDLDPIGGEPLLPGHRATYHSKVDILICTPGRLVDHLRSTPGFNLDDLEWLIIDEADKLLGQSYQGWLRDVMTALQHEKPTEELHMDEKIRRMIEWFPPPRVITKVVLSATMTRDLSLLNALKLRRPKLVVVDDVGHVNAADADGNDDETTKNLDHHDQNSGIGYEIPSTLQEWAIPVGDGSEKPLYLLRLLQTKIFPNDEHQGPSADEAAKDALPNSASSSEDDDSEISDAESSPSLSSDDLSSTSSSTDQIENGSKRRPKETFLPNPPSTSPNSTSGSTNHGVLIFTRSNEAASRLSRLLTHLHPSFSSQIGTLTSNHASLQRRKILRAFNTQKLSILIASNLVARGMDIPHLAHVVNYDIPTHVRDYVHRVGRTARAGREGQAWTLISDREAGWFWNAIARGTDLRRAQERKVVRYRLGLEGTEEEEKRYQDALRVLGEEVRAEKR
ncbi:MAG: hypothetical protein M1823_003372 [Watsoniomyces obsoletus]|nr:MAG: hypothetical protein M1823_003372 [Watsoniomyces obsoletus]